MPLGGYRGAGGTAESSIKHMSVKSGYESRERERERESQFNTAGSSEFQVRGAAVLNDRLANDVRPGCVWLTLCVWPCRRKTSWTCRQGPRIPSRRRCEALRRLAVTDLSVSNMPGCGWPSPSPSHLGSNTGGCSAGSSDDISGVADAATRLGRWDNLPRDPVLPGTVLGRADWRPYAPPPNHGVQVYTVAGAGCQYL